MNKPTFRWEYQHADGTLAGFVERHDLPDGGKAVIPHFKPDGRSGFVAGIPAGAMLPLYGIRMALAAPEAPLFITEGEKCAAALHGLGLAAVCSQGGANGSHKGNWNALAGHKGAVFLLLDNDDAGETYGAAVVSLLPPPLAGNAKVVRFPDLKEKGDVVDWLKALHEEWDGYSPLKSTLAVDAVEATATKLMDYCEYHASVPAPAATNKVEPLGRLKMVCLSDVEPEVVRWLWPNRIALGKLTVIAGDPGLGKSQLAANMAGTITTGQAWPDGTLPCAVGNIILLSAEDGVADTLLPRLHAAGADVSKCFALHAVEAPCSKTKQESVERGFDMGRDVALLDRELVRLPDTRLVVIDPISAYMGAVDSNNNADVRGILAPLADVAARRGVAMVLITHLNKAHSQTPMGRVMGSMGLVAAARAAWVVAKDKDDPARRLFLPMKNNLGSDVGNLGLAFRVEGAVVQEGIQTSRIVWESEAVDMTAEEALRQGGNVEAAADAYDAKAFLRMFLADGPKPAKEVLTAGEESGFSEKRLRTAGKNLSIKSGKAGMEEGWIWALPKPPKMPEGAQDALP